jgi:hypothetical protein
MAGGKGIHGVVEEGESPRQISMFECWDARHKQAQRQTQCQRQPHTSCVSAARTGVTPRVIQHIFALAEALRKKEKPGEKTTVSAYGLELYNEDLRDLALAGGRDDSAKGWDGKGGSGSTLKLQERPSGKDGRVVPEVRRHSGGLRLPRSGVLGGRGVGLLLQRTQSSRCLALRGRSLV